MPFHQSCLFHLFLFDEYIPMIDFMDRLRRLLFLFECFLTLDVFSNSQNVINYSRNKNQSAAWLPKIHIDLITSPRKIQMYPVFLFSPHRVYTRFQAGLHEYTSNSMFQCLPGLWHRIKKQLRTIGSLTCRNPRNLFWHHTKLGYKFLIWSSSLITPHSFHLNNRFDYSHATFVPYPKYI